VKQQILRWLPSAMVAVALALAIPPSAHAQQKYPVGIRPSSGGVPSVAGGAVTHNTPPFADSLTAGVKARKIITGVPRDQGFGNCFPFGCAYEGEYQQVYTSSLFKKKITIVGLQFANTQVDDGATTMNSGNFTVSLSTTSVDWDTITVDFNSNIGPDNTQVFNGSLDQPWAFGFALNVPFSKPFTYDPSAGNLLIDVQTSGTSDSNGFIYFDSNGYNNGGYNGDTIFGRVYCSFGSNCVAGNIVANFGYGLATAFVVRP
jgi:hypothetical protein